MADAAIEDALIKAAHRGVRVKICAENEDGAYNSAFSGLAKAGVKDQLLQLAQRVLLHGKVVEADFGTHHARAFVARRIFPAPRCAATASWGWSPRIPPCWLRSPGRSAGTSAAAPDGIDLARGAYVTGHGRLPADRPGVPAGRNRPHRHTFAVPLDHRQPGGEQIEVFAREVTAAGAAAGQRGRPALAAVPAGRPRVRRPAALGPRVLAGPGAGRLPGAAAGPARHRPVHARSPGIPWPGWQHPRLRPDYLATSGPTRSSATRN